MSDLVCASRFFVFTQCAEVTYYGRSRYFYCDLGLSGLTVGNLSKCGEILHTLKDMRDVRGSRIHAAKILYRYG